MRPRTNQFTTLLFILFFAIATIAAAEEVFVELEGLIEPFEQVAKVSELEPLPASLVQ